MHKLICSVLIGSMLFGAAPLFAGPSTVVTGRIDNVQRDHIMMGQQRYEVLPAPAENDRTVEKPNAQLAAFGTECWVIVSPRNYQIDYITLIHVGYVTLARVTLQNQVVQKIEILNLQQ